MPSVDMPLLREQRRAVRIRVVAFAVLGLSLVAGAVAAAVFVAMAPPSDAEATTRRPASAPAPMASAPDAAGDSAIAGSGEPDGGAALIAETEPRTLGATSRTVSRFGSARGFRQALAGAHLARDQALEVETALEDTLDFRRCRPDDQLIIERDADGHVVLFEFRGSPTEYYRATRTASGTLRGERVEVPVQRIRLARGGTVRSSLGDALSTVGLGRGTVGTFVGVFEGHVNFATDARRGDTFRVIMEEHRISGRFLRHGTVHALEYVGRRAGTLRAFWYEPRRGEGDYYDETGRAIHGGWLRAPLRYDRLSSRFDPRRMHPILHRIVPHNGTDYAAGTGTPVWAAASGTVTFAGDRGANGNLVSVRHDGGYESHYAHLSRIERGIASGVEVNQRQVIGYVGSTGRSTGPHLHFALERGGRFVDPLQEMNGPGRMMPAAALPRYREHVRELVRELEGVRLGSAPTQGPPATGPELAEADSEESPMD